MVVYYVVCILICIFGFIGLIDNLYKMNNDSKKELLDELLKNNEITKNVYIKYLNK
jgi:hypothetical protein